MDACLYIGHHPNEWVWELFPGKSPAELTIAGKSWGRFALDVCSMLGCENVFIADAFFQGDLKTRVGNGSFWSLNIRQLPTGDADSPEELFERHRDALPQDDILFFWNLTLPDLPEPERLFDHMRPVQDGDAPEEGIYLLRGGVLYRCECPLLRMRTLQEYFQLNFRMLHEPGMYVLPGYDPAHDNVNLGENVVIMPHVSIESPAIIRRRTYLGRSVELAGDVIIGESSLIEHGSRLKRTIVMAYTSIGRNMHFENKIVSGNRVIDAETGDYVDLSDHFMARSAAPLRFSWYSVAEFITALILTVGLLPLYLIGWLFRKGLGELPFFALLLRAYPVCPKVLLGSAQLVRLGMGDAPYAFRFSDLHLSSGDAHTRDMADVYYLNNKSVRLMLAVAFLSLVKRFFVISLPEPDDGEF